MALFKRPAWAKTHSSDAQDADENLFNHSSRAYQEIVAEDQRKRKERAEKQKAIVERKTSGEERKASGEERKIGKERARSPKRRRITLEEGKDLLESVGLGPIEISDDDDKVANNSTSPVRKSPRFSKTVNRITIESHVPSLHGSVVLPVADDADDGSYVAKPKPRASEPEEEEESDEDLAELKRQARERRRQREDQKHQTSIPDVRARVGQPPPSTGSAPSLLDPPIKLLISSELPDTQPLIVFRRLSQRLKEIREVWCKKQGFTDLQMQDIFLIHNMKRIYDVTTCKSLGLDVDRDGIVTLRGAEGMDDLDKVHLEAVNEEVFTRLRVERARQERKRKGLQQLDESGPGASEDQTALKQPSGEPLIKILLKAKGHEPFRLKVKPTTVFSKIVAACRKNFTLPDGQEVWLEFDGEKLDPIAEVQSAEIEDMDSIDVHVS